MTKPLEQLELFPMADIISEIPAPASVYMFDDGDVGITVESKGRLPYKMDVAWKGSTYHYVLQRVSS